jgi:hypothetical protein
MVGVDGILPEETASVDTGVFDIMLALWEAEKGSSTKAIKDFVKFSNTYLDENRPMQTFFPEGNTGAILSNGTRVMLCPPVNIQSGAVDLSGVMPITGIQR